MQPKNDDDPPHPGASANEPLNPIALFGDWLETAKTTEINDANAMALATSDTHGLPDVRMVLLKDFSDRGFVFYTNIESQKGTQLRQNMQAAAVLHWKSIRRQVRLRGLVESVPAGEADEYFASRPRDSQIGAWASQQSRPLESRFALEKAVARAAGRFGLGGVPRPPYWSGFRIVPIYLEFWTDKMFRLHDRVVFRRESPQGAWRTERLFP
jgi:pyridoxamine 5'-phosphate oxidase